MVIVLENRYLVLNTSTSFDQLSLAMRSRIGRIFYGVFEPAVPSCCHTAAKAFILGVRIQERVCWLQAIDYIVSNTNTKKWACMTTCTDVSSLFPTPPGANG